MDARPKVSVETLNAVMQLSFKQQILVTLLDKGALALIVAFAGYLLSRALEKFKALQLIRSEKTKARIQAMATTWGEITAFRSFANMNAPLARKSEEGRKSREAIRQALKDVVNVIERNRFLCGNKFSDDALQYTGWLEQYYERIVFEGKQDVEHTYEKIRALGADIESIDNYLDS